MSCPMHARENRACTGANAYACGPRVGSGDARIQFFVSDKSCQNLRIIAAPVDVEVMGHSKVDPCGSNWPDTELIDLPLLPVLRAYPSRSRIVPAWFLKEKEINRSVSPRGRNVGFG